MNHSIKLAANTTRNSSHQVQPLVIISSLVVWDTKSKQTKHLLTNHRMEVRHRFKDMLITLNDELLIIDSEFKIKHMCKHSVTYNIRLKNIQLRTVYETDTSS